MFKIGDLVTGTVDNDYGYICRGAICRVVGFDGEYKSIIIVKIIGFDDDMLRDGHCSSIIASETTRRWLIEDATEYPVKACFFEPYRLYMEEGSVSELNDFLDEM